MILEVIKSCLGILKKANKTKQANGTTSVTQLQILFNHFRLLLVLGWYEPNQGKIISSLEVSQKVSYYPQVRIKYSNI